MSVVYTVYRKRNGANKKGDGTMNNKDGKEIIVKNMRATRESISEFVDLCEEEGRKQSKMFEILLATYKKSKEEQRHD